MAPRALRLVVPALALSLAFCGGRSGLEGEILEEDAGPVDAPVEAHEPRDAGRCPAGKHFCAGVCIEESPQACGPSCTPCPVPLHGQAECRNGACAIVCDEGYTACEDACCTAQVVSGGYHSCTLRPNGTVYCWGSNSEGQLGDGTTADRSQAVMVQDLPGKAITLAAGGNQTCAVVANGSVYCWGEHRTADSRTIPTKVEGLPGPVTALAVKHLHACVVIDGEVWCWGPFGLPNPSYKPTRVEGVAPDRARSVVVGSQFACAVLESGGVECWGANAHGELGNGTLLPSEIAGPVEGLHADVRELAAGDLHVCAIQGAGVKCWGHNLEGQLGAVTASWSNPFAVEVKPPVMPALHIGAGHLHTCYLTGGGLIGCWGRNSSGQLGDHEPGGPGFHGAIDLAGLVQVVGGVGHTCALKNNHAVFCWGSNAFGQLGDGTGVSSVRPVLVKGF